MSLIVDGTSGVTFNDSSLQGAAASPYVLKNRIINGAMVIAQRATTYSGIGQSSYQTLDRFLLDTRINASPTGSYTQAQSTDAPTGFNYSFSVTTTTAGNSLAATYALQFMQFIEGYNIADLGWGTANAQTVTLSFWIKASIAGVYSLGIVSTAYDRSYVANYTVNSANTWEYKTITIVGPTSGTWDTTNGRGMMIRFSLGSGSNYITSTPNTWLTSEFEQSSTASASSAFWSTTGATWKITGVQLEQNTSATPFERRLYNQELANCQRYYAKLNSGGTAYGGLGVGFASTTTQANILFKYPITMRANPTASQSGTAINTAAANPVVTSLGTAYPTPDNTFINMNVASGLTIGQGIIVTGGAAGTGYVDFTAEL